MTSPVAGGGGPSRPSGTDPVDVDLTPPADPWLAAVTTSTLSGEAVGAAPSAVDAWPTADVVADDLAAPTFSPTPARGRKWWVLALLAVVLVVAGLVFLVVHQLSGDHVTTRDDRPRAAAGQPPAATGAGSTGDATGQSPAVVVTYEVTAGRSHNVGSVQYTDRDGDIIQRGGVPLPWKLTFPVTGRRHPLVLITQRTAGAESGPVTCTITAAGKVLSQVTQTGRYAAPECSANLP